MDTILTLNIDQDVVENAENYAKYAKKSVSQLVEEYLLLISSKNKADDNDPLGPLTRQLTGIIKLDKNVNDKELLSDALAEKYL
ncbi:MAG TPA: hypothetical protein DEQ14_12130 [Treponema sp.]|nr:hypothetical protein [Treponema sp.]